MSCLSSSSPHTKTRTDDTQSCKFVRRVLARQSARCQTPREIAEYYIFSIAPSAASSAGGMRSDRSGCPGEISISVRSFGPRAIAFMSWQNALQNIPDIPLLHGVCHGIKLRIFSAGWPGRAYFEILPVFTAYSGYYFYPTEYTTELNSVAFLGGQP